METGIYRLPVSGLQHEYRVFSDGCARTFALGQGVDDGAELDFAEHLSDFGSPGDQYSMSAGGLARFKVFAGLLECSRIFDALEQERSGAATLRPCPVDRSKVGSDFTFEYTAELLHLHLER